MARIKPIGHYDVPNPVKRKFTVHFGDTILHFTISENTFLYFGRLMCTNLSGTQIGLNNLTRDLNETVNRRCVLPSGSEKIGVFQQLGTFNMHLKRMELFWHS